MKPYAALAALLLLAACDYLPSWMGGAEKHIERLPGEREDVLAISSELAADPSLGQVPFKLPPVNGNADWAQHTGQFPAAGGNLAGGDFATVQNVPVGEGNEFSHTLVPRPVVAGGIVYAMDAAGYISAHEAADIGKKRWISPSLVTKHEDEAIGGGLAVDGGRLYAASGLGRVAALDAAGGGEIWKREMGIPLRSAPRAAGTIVFVISIDSQLFALDSATGATLWTHRGIGETAGLMNNISPTMAGDMVIVPYASGELYALKAATGDEVWRASLAKANRTEATAIFSGIGGDPVVDESVVFAVSSSGLFSVFNLLSGQPMWEKAIASINTPWVAGDYIYLLTEDNRLLSMVKYDGRIRWSLPLKSFKDEKRKLQPIVWRGPVVVGGRVAVASTDGQMLLVDGGTGGIVSTLDIPDEMSTAPVVAGGQLFLIDKDAKLYSYR